ncbi:hypothetical protein B0H19DRAFT_1256178 [Mycena capillaripes]|nr:hypothetical protein B0H19DRAFT_1256178 [Mycena capillaripes]
MQARRGSALAARRTLILRHPPSSTTGSGWSRWKRVKVDAPPSPLPIPAPYKAATDGRSHRIESQLRLAVGPFLTAIRSHSSSLYVASLSLHHLHSAQTRVFDGAGLCLEVLSPQARDALTALSENASGSPHVGSDVVIGALNAKSVADMDEQPLQPLLSPEAQAGLTAIAQHNRMRRPIEYLERRIRDFHPVQIAELPACEGFAALSQNPDNGMAEYLDAFLCS